MLLIILFIVFSLLLKLGTAKITLPAISLISKNAGKLSVSKT